MYTFYLGVDLHLKRSYVVLMKDVGQIIDPRGLPNDKMKEYLSMVISTPALESGSTYLIYEMEFDRRADRCYL